MDSLRHSVFRSLARSHNDFGGSAACVWRIMPRLWATATASVRLMASSLFRMALTCVLAMPSVMASRRAISCCSVLEAGRAGRRLRDRSRAAGYQVRQIARASRSRVAQQGQERLKGLLPQAPVPHGPRGRSSPAFRRGSRHGSQACPRPSAADRPGGEQSLS